MTTRLESRRWEVSEGTWDHIEAGRRILAAAIVASSEQPDSPASAVTDGISRSLNCDRLGSWADRQIHRWESVELPAWVELALPEKSVVREVYLTFDTGFDRELMLSSSGRS